jgi:hypothetical protein
MHGFDRYGFLRAGNSSSRCLGQNHVISWSRQQPAQAFRACAGFLGLTMRHDAERLDAVSFSSSVAAILKNRQEARAPEQQASLLHANPAVPSPPI